MPVLDAIPREVCRSALILIGAPVTPESIDAMHGVLMAQRDHDVERAREESASVAALFPSPELNIEKMEA